MVRIILVRPGATDYDQQGRIKGTLDIPLNEAGSDQVRRAAQELQGQSIEVIYCSPCRSAGETADLLRRQWDVKVKVLRDLTNLDHGLWQGKLIEEVRQKQRKAYRQWQEQPETVCPPEGELLGAVQQRIRPILAKLIKKHKAGVVALVVPEPLASVVSSHLEGSALGDLWKAECSCGSWQMIEVEPDQFLSSVTSDNA
jgi:probable phosphoglycerate mutase